jgi:hypothetical protein
VPLVEPLRVDVLDKDVDTTDDDDVDTIDNDDVDAIDNNVDEDADAAGQISTSISLEMAKTGDGRSDQTKGSSKQKHPASCPFGL